MPVSKPSDIDEYISGFPEETQKLLLKLRSIIKTEVPGSLEGISYSMPAFYLNGRYLIYFAGYKNHIGLYPVPEKNKEFEKDFAGYRTSGRGTIQFPLNKPLPRELIRDVHKY